MISFWITIATTSRLVSMKMARDPSQDRVKSPRDPYFVKQRFIVLIPTLEVIHFLGKRIFETFHKKKEAAWTRTSIHVIENCVHLSFARSITRQRRDVLQDPLCERDPLDRALMTSLYQGRSAHFQYIFDKNTHNDKCQQTFKQL